MNAVRVAAAIAALWLVGNVATAGPADPGRIMIKDFMFSPMTLTTQVGVEGSAGVNQDDEPHTVVSDTGLFRSGALDTGNSFTYRFDKPGTYHVFCSMHPQMTATIVVE